MRQTSPLPVVALLAAALWAGPAAAAEHSYDDACPNPDAQPETQFSDVDGHMFQAAIRCSSLWEVAGGYPDGTYRPQAAVTRGQMATFVARAYVQMGGYVPADADEPFEDVAADGTHAADIAGLYQRGMVAGVTDTLYRPSLTVTRGQMATFVVRLLERANVPTTAGDANFDDVDPDGVHADDIGRLHATGLVNGLTDDTYGPSRPVTRGQMATFLMRAAEHAVETGSARPPAAADMNWPQPETAGDLCTHTDLVETHRQMTVTSTEAYTNTDNDVPERSCMYGSSDGALTVTVDGWVPPWSVQQIASTYSMPEVFLGEAGVGRAAVVQHSAEHNTTWLYVDMGRTTLEVRTDSWELAADEQADRLLALASEIAPRLWPEADTSTP